MNIPDTDPPQRVQQPWPRRVLRTILIYAGIPYCTVIALAFCFQRSLMYHPAPAANLSVKVMQSLSEETGDKDVKIETPDGDTIKGWLVRHRGSAESSSPAPVVIYFPGNAGNRLHRLTDTWELGSAGFDVLFFDYRGYGDSTGSPSEVKLTSDARLIWKYARETLHYDASRIVLFGESLGGAVALSLWGDDETNHPQPAAVVLNSTFAYMPDVVQWHYPYFPFRYLVLDRWPSGDRIAQVKCPVTLFHGTSDEIVPFSQSHVLTSKAHNSQLIELRGVTHNNVPISRLRDELVRIRQQIVAKDAPTSPTLESE